MRPDLPAGTVTFLFTDIEGSTKLLHELGREALAEALRGAFRAPWLTWASGHQPPGSSDPLPHSSMRWAPAICGWRAIAKRPRNLARAQLGEAAFSRAWD